MNAIIYEARHSLTAAVRIPLSSDLHLFVPSQLLSPLALLSIDRRNRMFSPKQGTTLQVRLRYLHGAEQARVTPALWAPF